MSAFGGKPDMTFRGSPLLRSLLGAKRTCPFALHMSANDPKRTWTIALHPVLLLLGGDSPPAFGRANAALEKTLPNSRSEVMPGQNHYAMDTASELLVGAVLDFWRDVTLSAADEVIE
jgi:pimeloyl-ACP methyl ester carboxylesterase